MNEVTKTCDLEEKKNIKEQEKQYHHKLKGSVKQWTREKMKRWIRGNRKTRGRQDFKHGTDYTGEISMTFNSDLWLRILQIFGDNCFSWEDDFPMRVEVGTRTEKPQTHAVVASWKIWEEKMKLTPKTLLEKQEASLADFLRWEKQSCLHTKRKNIEKSDRKKWIIWQQKWGDSLGKNNQKKLMEEERKNINKGNSYRYPNIKLKHNSNFIVW